MSLFIGLMVAICASLVGTVIGAIAGYRGGKLDDILMRVTDLFLAFPTIVLLLVLRNLFHNVEPGWSRSSATSSRSASWSCCSSR